MDIKPIKTEADYESTLQEIDQLFDAEPGTPEGDKLEVLVTLVEAYEAQHHKIPLPDPIDAIEHYVESRGLTKHDLEPYIGSRSRVYEILNRKRPLTLRMIRNLEAGLGIPAAILVQKYTLNLEEHVRGAEVETVDYEEWVSTRLEHIEELFTTITGQEAGVSNGDQSPEHQIPFPALQHTLSQNVADDCRPIEGILVPEWPVRKNQECGDALTRSEDAADSYQRG